MPLNLFNYLKNVFSEGCSLHSTFWHLNISTYKCFLFIVNMTEKTPALITSPGAIKFKASLDC